MESLRILILFGCSELKKFPEVQGNMKYLPELSLEGTAIEELPSSIEYLTGLVLLNLKDCKSLEKLPSSICKLTSLQTLILCGCSELKKLPDGLGNLQRLVELNADGSGIQEVPPSITSLSSLQSLSFAGCKGLVCEGLSLYSLRSLNLSDCNLLQLPGDLSSLSSLNYLDLSRNSFITMPDNLSQLSQLQRLRLMLCESLQSLPKLPSSIEYLDAHSCTSLETLSFSLLAFKVEKFGRFEFKFTNCFRLAENQRSDIVEAILEGIQLVSSIPKFLEGLVPTPYSRYNAFVTGSRIPEWFTHQSVGSSVNIELPRHWYNSKLMGLAVCVVFNIKSNEASASDWSDMIHCCLDGIYWFHSSITLGVDVLDEGNQSYDELLESWYGSAERTRFIESDHTWFGYQSLGRLDESDYYPMRKLRGSVRVSFSGDSSSFEVKKCGVRVVYEQDENDRGCIFPLGKLPKKRDIALFMDNYPFIRNPPDLHYLCSREYEKEKLQGGSSHGSELELNLPHSRMENNNEKGKAVMTYESESLDLNKSLNPDEFSDPEEYSDPDEFSDPEGFSCLFGSSKLSGRGEKLLVYDGKEKDSQCSFRHGTMSPAEGDESEELRQSCSPCNILTNIFMLLKQICVPNQIQSISESESEPLPPPSSPPIFASVSAGAMKTVLKIPESSQGDTNNIQKAGDSLKKQETAFSSAVSASTSTTGIFSFGVPANNSNLNNGSLASSCSPSSSPAFMFSSTPSSGANPFQFGSQQNPAKPQNPSPFQASNSLDLNAGGSFSLGTGVGDKANRGMVKVKHPQRKK